MCACVHVLVSDCLFFSVLGFREGCVHSYDVVFGLFHVFVCIYGLLTVEEGICIERGG